MPFNLGPDTATSVTSACKQSAPVRVCNARHPGAGKQFGQSARAQCLETAFNRSRSQSSPSLHRTAWNAPTEDRELPSPLLRYDTARSCRVPSSALRFTAVLLVQFS
jgi:hypothetical protein